MGLVLPNLQEFGWQSEFVVARNRYLSSIDLPELPNLKRFDGTSGELAFS